MTPIQKHEQELRALMERAGLMVDETNSRTITAKQPGASVLVSVFNRTCSALADHDAVDGPPVAYAGHADPRIALRACLEMAGLLVDRPPQTDAELVAWLTERWGEPLRMGGVTSWGRADIRLFHSDGGWVRDNGCDLSARELGAILWTAERFPEAQP